MEIREVEVDFKKYCPKCKDAKTPEKNDPCNECLAQPFNYQTEKPIHFKEAD